MSDLVRFARLPLGSKFLLAEALLALALVSLMRKVLPFRLLVRAVGRPNVEMPHAALAPEVQGRAEAVLNVIRAAGQALPFFRNCLVQAVSAKLMLRRRRIPSTLYFSVATGAGGAEKRIIGHAWLRCGQLTFRQYSIYPVIMLTVGDDFP